LAQEIPVTSKDDRPLHHSATPNQGDRLGAVTPQPDAVFVDGLGFFTSAEDRLDVSNLERRPSPCETWRALDVLGHVGAAAEFGTLVLMARLVASGPSRWGRRR